jgi:hypothetical protein
VVAIGLFLLMARLIRIHEVREIITTVLRRNDDSSPEAREVREESAIGPVLIDLASSSPPAIPRR